MTTSAKDRPAPRVGLLLVCALTVSTGLFVSLPAGSVAHAAPVRPEVKLRPQPKTTPGTVIGHRSTFRPGPSATTPKTQRPHVWGQGTISSDRAALVGDLSVSLRPTPPATKPGRAAKTPAAPLTAAIETHPAAGSGVALTVTPDTTRSDTAAGTGSEAMMTVSGQALAGSGDALARTVAVVDGKTVPTAVNMKTQSVSFPVSMARTSAVRLAATTSGSSGDYSATTLSPSATWGGGGQSGSFTWSYGLRTPPSAGGLDPTLNIGYDSGSVDGRVASTNNQPSWLGEGFTLEPGFIQRSFTSCDEDMSGGSNASHKTYDLCWDGDNASIVLDGKSSRLIRDAASGAWRLKDDDNSTVQKLTGAPNGDQGSGGAEGEYWLVTRTDGTRYYFGKESRYAGDAHDTNSTQLVPVNGNHSGEPCYDATFASGFCNQAYRWNLDYVVDPHGNSITYTFAKESNRYGRDLNDTSVAYDRGAYLTRIDYGQVAGSETDANVQQQVTFDVAERCIPNAGQTCAEANLTSATQTAWPDVPFDLICSSTSSCGSTQTSPSFFTRKRLVGVNTFVTKASTLTPVESWGLAQSLPVPGDGTSASLWLDSITRSGKSGGTLTLPAVQFGKQQMMNRVDRVGDGADPLYKYRVASISTETGATINIEYTGADCVADSSMPTGEDSNTRRCYPQYWSPPGASDPEIGYFHKYLVSRLTEDSGIFGSESKVTTYTYNGAPAWHYDDQVMLPATRRTWSDFRGYQSVTTTTGNATQTAPLKTTSTYLRGMHGDKLKAGGTRTVTVTASDGTAITDKDQWNGHALEAATWNGGSEVGGEVNVPWSSAATATSPQGTAYITRTESTTNRATITGQPTPRRTRTTTSFTADGYPVQVADEGDLAEATDQRCSSLTYAPTNTALNLRGLVTVANTVAVGCGTTPAADGSDVLKDLRTSYDGLASTGTPTKGDITKTERLNAPGTYATVSATGYDTVGRPVTSTDALGYTTTTAYTPADAQATTQVSTTNAIGHLTKTTVDPAFGLATAVTDPNNKTTNSTYDPLGRSSKVWLANKAVTAIPSYQYSYVVSKTGPAVVTTNSIHADGVTQVTSTALFDGLLRPLQTQTPVADVSINPPKIGRSLTDVSYDSRGLLIASRGPWLDMSAAPGGSYVSKQDQEVPQVVRSTFDGAGRITQVDTLIAGALHDSTTTVHNGDSVDVLPPTGGIATRTVTDARGNTTALWQYHGNTVTAAKDVTSYTVNNKDQLVKLTDPAGTAWSWGYDILGRQTTSTDPDKGASASTYDVKDQVLTSTDARNITLTYTYDKLGRKLTEANGPTTLASWTYDKTGNLGLPYTASSFTGGGEYKQTVLAYDKLNQPTTMTTTIPATETGLAGTYLRTNRYGFEGSLLGSTMPTAPGLTAETWGEDRNIINQPLGLTAASSIVSGSQRDETGALTQYVMSAITGKGVSTSQVYEQGTHRLKQLRIDRDNILTPDVHTTYAYDPAGNLLSAADIPEPANSTRTDNQCFQYDRLRRLTEAWSNATTSCAATPTYTATGVAPYWTSWTFDGANNRQTETRHTTTNTTLTYAYPAAVSATPNRPHAATTVSTQVGAAAPTSQNLAYTPAGQTTSAPLNGTQAAITWNDQGRLSTITRGTATSGNIYDAAGDLLVKKLTDGSKVLLLGDTEITHNPATSTTTSRRIFGWAGQTVAVRTANGFAGLWFAPPGPQGTPSVQINASTGAITKRYYTPYGSPRGTTPAWQGLNTFLGATGATADAATNLTHLGAREYDPALGVFLSVDPVMDLTDPGQWSGYAYSQHNPITYSDPSGLRMIGRSDNDAIVVSTVGGKVHNTTDSTVVQSTIKDSNIRATGGMTPAERKEYAPIAYARWVIEDTSAALAARDEYIRRSNRVAVQRVAAVGNAVVPVQDAIDCAQGDGASACVSAAAGLIPGKAGTAGKFAFKGALEVTDGLILKEAAKTTEDAVSSVRAGAGGSLDNISVGEAARIQNAADRIGHPISLVGSRASGKAGAYSDWDYVVTGVNSRVKHSVSGSLPRGAQELGYGRQIDVFTGPLNDTRPHITFIPRGAQ